MWEGNRNRLFQVLPERRSVKAYLPVNGYILHVMPKIQDKYFYFLKTPKILNYSFRSLRKRGSSVYLLRFSLLLLVTPCPSMCVLSGLISAVGTTTQTEPCVSMPFCFCFLVFLAEKGNVIDRIVCV